MKIRWFEMGEGKCKEFGCNTPTNPTAQPGSFSRWRRRCAGGKACRKKKGVGLNIWRAGWRGKTGIRPGHHHLPSTTHI